jgi:aminoglycoside phosphotransferase (APT) family kinase protein
MGPSTPVDEPSRWPDPAEVCSAFGLHGAVFEVVPLDRAWSNRVFRLRVGRNDYLLKELRPNPWRPERWFERVEAAFAFEQIALASGVRAPRPIPTPAEGKALAWVGRRNASELVPVRLHHFVDAKPCPNGPVEPGIADWAGEALAALHALDIEPGDPSLYPVPTIDIADAWPDLIQSTAELGHPWADDLQALAPVVARAARMAATGLAKPGRAVMSHGDVDQKNIMLSEDGPVLCDWDGAEPWVPSRELLILAISMGVGEFDVSRRVVAAYERAAGHAMQLSGDDLAPSLMLGLDWVVLNVERAVGLRLATKEEVALSTNIVPGLLADYRHNVELADRVMERLGR